MSRLDDVDAAALQYALAAIDDWDIDVASLLDDCGYRDEAPVRPKRHREAPYHQRKRELQILRDQVESLQQTLAQETCQEWSKTADTTTALERECQAIVSRQAQARFAAQLRNKELRKRIEELRRDARKIARLGHRMLALEKALPRSLTCRLQGYSGPREPPHTQLLRLPGLHHEASSVFSSGAFAEHSSDRMKIFREVALRESRSSCAAVEVVFETAWVLPFAVEDVADALWVQTTRVMTGNNVIQWQDVHTQGSAVVSQFVSVPTDIDASQTVKCGQIATHRYVSDDGSSLIVSNVQVHAQHVPASIGVYTSDVWARVGPISRSATSPLTQILWCRRVRLLPPATQSESVSKRTEWMKSILSGYSGSLRAREERTMNTLDEIDAMTLQQALQVADDWVSELNNWQELRPRRQRSLARQLHELRAQIEQLKRTHSRVRASRAQITVAIEECVALRREQEAVVARQRQARLDAETLNVQLREACDIARRDSLKIARLSRRLLSLEMAVPSPLIVNPQAFEIVRQDPERQRRRLLQLREDADGMLAMGPLEKGAIDGALELRSILSSRRVAFNCAWIVPFSVDDVAEAAWLQTTRLATGYDSSTQWLDLYGDASSLGSQFVYAAADGVAKYGQIATRRDVLADGTIQLVSTIEVQAIEGGVSVGQFETDIWSRIVPISTNANAPLTQIQWCRRRCYHASQLPRQTVPNPIPLGEYAMFQRNKQAAENALVVKSAQQRMRKGN